MPWRSRSTAIPSRATSTSSSCSPTARSPPRSLADEEKLQELTTEKGLIALRFVIDPDAALKSAAPYHPALTAFVSSGAFAQWQSTASDESTVAGRISTEGLAGLAGQRWRYDLTFSAPIVLDPEAETVGG